MVGTVGVVRFIISDDLPGTDELAGDHRRPEEEVEAAGDASRGALQHARPLLRREREDGVHERSCAAVSLML